MVFQDPLSALNPFYKVGEQIGEAYLVHHPDASKSQVREVVLDSLQKVGIPEPTKRIDSYPHEFSGGMRQRIVIAMALVNSPRLLIADEPTTALDVTVQAQILELIKKMQRELGMAVIFITHDLGVIAQMASYVVVMYLGKVMEQGPVDEIFHAPKHPYTRALLASRLSMDPAERVDEAPLTGDPPNPINPPSGCRFRTRCPFAEAVCTDKAPMLPRDIAVGPAIPLA